MKRKVDWYAQWMEVLVDIWRGSDYPGKASRPYEIWYHIKCLYGNGLITKEQLDEATRLYEEAKRRMA